MWSIAVGGKKKNNSLNYKNILITPDDFNNYFSGVANEIVTKLPTVAKNYATVEKINVKFNFKQVSEYSVREVITNIKNKPSKDIYDMNIMLIKHVIDIIISPLTKIINVCIEEGVFPTALKMGKVVPLHKGGSTDNLNNFRPISVLPIFSKIFESILKIQINDFLNKNNLIFQNQYGFQNGKSTVDAILHLTEIVSRGFENKEYVGSIFCDLQKAFDCVCHKKLLLKLKETYSFSNKSLNLIESYLSDRHQIVKINGVLSQVAKITRGVPQGSVLGPVFFLIYINEMKDNFPETDITLFADDNTLSKVSYNIEILKCQLDQTQLEAKLWFSSMDLCLNDQKTKTMVFSLREINFENVEMVKFLGVILDPVLNWQPHISEVSNKISKNIYLLRRLQNMVLDNVLKIAFHSLVMSYASYALICWGHAPAANQIFRLQRKALRVISNTPFRDDVRPKFKEYSILTIPSLYVLHCLLYVKQNFAKYEVVKNLHNHNTRSSVKS